MKVQHFVMTKFNLRIAEMSERLAYDKHGEKIDRDAWLAHRFELFERYCLPSMAAQTNKDFTWLLYFDSETTQPWLDRIETAKARCPQIKTVFLPSSEGVLEAALELVESDTEALITTRFDNDDAFHQEAMAVTRAQADTAGENFCINLTFGLVLSNANDAIEVEESKYNSFASLVEFRNQGEFRGMRGRHGKIHQLAPVRQVGDKPLWLRVAHEQNIINRGPADWQQLRFSSLLGFAQYLKRYLGRAFKRLLWPLEARREYSLGEVKKQFNLDIQ